MSRPGHKVPWHTRGWTWFERKLTGHPHFWGKSMEKTRKKHGICMVCGRFSLESSQWPKLHKNCRA
jgi:hypothetical protein